MMISHHAPGSRNVTPITIRTIGSNGTPPHRFRCGVGFPDTGRCGAECCGFCWPRGGRSRNIGRRSAFVLADHTSVLRSSYSSRVRRPEAKCSPRADAAAARSASPIRGSGSIFIRDPRGRPSEANRCVWWSLGTPEVWEADRWVRWSFGITLGEQTVQPATGVGEDLRGICLLLRTAGRDDLPHRGHHLTDHRLQLTGLLLGALVEHAPGRAHLLRVLLDVGTTLGSEL